MTRALSVLIAVLTGIVQIASPLWAQNASNAVEVALLRWYPANLVAQFTTCGGTNGYGLAFDGEHMWVACSGLNEFQEFESSDNMLIRTVTGVTSPHSLIYDGTNIWASNYATAGKLIKVNGSTGVILGSFTVGVSPQDLAFDGTFVWVVNSGSNSVSQVLATTGAVTTYSLPSCSAPQGITFDGANLWVSCSGSGTVEEIDTAGNLLKTVTVGTTPTGLTFDGTNIWVANQGSNSVTRINAATLAMKTVAVGTSPTAAVFDTKWVWVTNSGSNTVSKIVASSGGVAGNSLPAPDRRSLALTEAMCGCRIALQVAPFRSFRFRGPNGMWFSVRCLIGRSCTMLMRRRYALFLGLLLFSFPLFAQNPSNPIEVALLRWYGANSLAQFSTCSGPAGLAFDGFHMWVACPAANQIQEFNTSDGKLVRTITGVTNPFRLVYDGADIWTDAQGGSTVSKVQANTGVVLATYTVGTQPQEMIFDGKNIWVANLQANSVSRITISTAAIKSFFDAHFM